MLLSMDSSHSLFISIIPDETNIITSITLTPGILSPKKITYSIFE